MNSLVFLIEALGLVILQRSKHLATLDAVSYTHLVLSALITVFMAIPLHRSLAVAEQKMKITASIPCESLLPPSAWFTICSVNMEGGKLWANK